MHSTALDENPSGEHLPAGSAPRSRARSERRCWLVRPRPGTAVSAAVVGLALAAAACGHRPAAAGVAGAASGSPTTVAPAAGGSTGLPSMADRLAYAKCMRSRGEPDWPDPGSGSGEGSGGTAAPTVDRNSPQYITANNACKHLLGAGGPNQAQNQQRTEQALKFARCMRAHGISDFPDSMQINGQGDLNPNNPQFQAASQACQPLRPGRSGATP